MGKVDAALGNSGTNAQMRKYSQSCHGLQDVTSCMGTQPLHRGHVKDDGWSSVPPGKSQEHHNPAGNHLSDVFADRLFTALQFKGCF